MLYELIPSSWVHLRQQQQSTALPFLPTHYYCYSCTLPKADLLKWMMNFALPNLYHTRSPPASVEAVHCFAFSFHPLLLLQLYLTESRYSETNDECHCLTYIASYILEVHLRLAKGVHGFAFSGHPLSSPLTEHMCHKPSLNQNEEKPPCLDSMWVMLWATSPHSIRLSGCQKTFCTARPRLLQLELHCIAGT